MKPSNVKKGIRGLSKSVILSLFICTFASNYCVSSVILPSRPTLEVIKLKVQRHRYAKCPPFIHQCLIPSSLSPSLHVQLSHLIPTIKDAPLTSRVTAARRIEVRKLDVPNITPVIDVLPIIVSISFPSSIGLQRSTYNATQILAPATCLPIHIEIVQQNDKHDKNRHQAQRPRNPPRPPRASPPLEEMQRVLEESRDSRIGTIAITLHNRFIRRILIDACT
jgi:hypothetical protein